MTSGSVPSPEVLVASSLLVNLPNELLAEIISHYPDPFTFCSPLLRREHGLQERQDRRQILRSLSQTCSTLRDVFLPLLWERFDPSSGSFNEEYTKHPLITLIFPYIRSVHVSMLNWNKNAREPVFLFVQFLGMLPNLRGVQIHPHSRLLPVLVYAFSDVKLPGVTSLSVPEWSEQIFPAFPNVTTLACVSTSKESKALQAAKKYLPRLEALAVLRLSEALIHEIVRDFPHLRALSVSSTGPLESSDRFDLLRRLKRLSQLSLVHEDVEHLPSLDALIQAGTDVLRASASTEPKVLRIWSYSVHEGFDVVPRVVCVNA
ncbi:hypothetical protein C8R43DRAFT_1234112 [Mycena crocata]|nr:hypothetical protein C8R43DRAFT_1234112 [Mycena crocata]